VPEGVVDDLESVEVDEENGDAVGAGGQRRLHPGHEQRPAGQPGERVAERPAHGLQRAGVGDGEAHVLGERVEHLLGGFVPVPGGGERADRDAAHGAPVLPYRGGHHRPQPGGGQGGHRDG
jgi:hypothetical protein